MEKDFIDLIALILQKTSCNLDPGLPEDFCTFAVDQRIRVCGAVDDLSDVLLDNGFCAGWCFTVVAAWFQGNVKCGSPGILTAVCQCVSSAWRPPYC